MIGDRGSRDVLETRLTGRSSPPRERQGGLTCNKLVSGMRTARPRAKRNLFEDERRKSCLVRKRIELLIRDALRVIQMTYFCMHATTRQAV